jgi:hypothetical protein
MRYQKRQKAGWASPQGANKSALNTFVCDDSTHLPYAEKLDEEVVGESVEEHLTDEVDITGQGGLEHDGHVGGVEELDGVRTSLTPHLARLDGDFNPESLQVDDDSKDDDGSQKVHDVGESFPVESFLESTRLVVPSEEQVEESDNSTFELGTSTGVDSVGGECLPDDVFANVGSDEERDTRSETVALGEKLIEEHDNEGCRDELENKQETNTGTERRRGSVKTGQDVDGSLTERDDEGEHCKSAFDL